MSEFTQGFVWGIVLVLIALIITIQIFPNPFMYDCGCGAMSSMCGQCIRGGNLSSPICSAFLSGAP
jgi:hypothetical protein